MGLKDLLKSTVKRALGRGEAPAPTPAPEARPTRSGSHPAPPPWRAAQAPVAQAAAPVVEPVVAPQASPEEPPWHDQVSQNPNDWMNNGALPPGDDPQVAAPTFDVVLDAAAGDEAWAPTAEERAARRDEPQEMAPPPAITPSDTWEAWLLAQREYVRRRALAAMTLLREARLARGGCRSGWAGPRAQAWAQAPLRDPRRA